MDQADTQQTSRFFLSGIRSNCAEVMYVLLPFVTLVVHRLWQGDAQSIFLGYEAAFVTAVLSGLSVHRFSQVLRISSEYQVPRTRIVFCLCVIMGLLLIPSLVLITHVSEHAPVNGKMAYLQSLMLLFALSLHVYSLEILESLRLKP